MSFGDEERFGRPSTVATTENVAEVWEAIMEDRQQNIRDVFKIVGLSYGTCQQWILLVKLKMRRIAIEFVPRLLSFDRKEYRISVCTELKEQAEKTQTLCPTSLLVTNLWCLGTTLRLKARLHGSPMLIDTVESTKVNCVNSSFQRGWRVNKLAMANFRSLL